MFRRLQIALAATIVGLLPQTGFSENPTVLMFTKSQGFQHPVVQRKKEDLSMAERIVTELGKKHGFDVTCTKDGTAITPDNLKNYQVLYFFSQGEIDKPKNPFEKSPAVDPALRQCVLDFVQQGGGLVGTHCGGADTWHEWKEGDKKPFLNMVGGEFAGHGSQQETTVRVVDPNFPAVKGWPSQFKLTDEWYTYSGFQKNMHVLMMIETEGMKEPMYTRRDDYPITWCSMHGDGRVFYTGLGHREDVWENELYQQMVAHGILWAAKKIEGDASPNLEAVFGDADKALERLNSPFKKE